ncbi:MAG: adenylosuccinate synthase [Acholeplasmatales bacterium]|nr:adenylosuccinate synthase [Acholeplasmatales bacterium]
MSTLVVEGSQWGDEGKGKITDYLAQEADVVVRSQGGNNAGHTIVINNEKFALRSIPSGIFNPRIKNILANGMVINPKQLLEELHGLEARGIKDYKLYISNRAHIVLPYHETLDGAYEDYKGSRKIGTTKHGIGPCYSDKANRIGIRIGEFVNEEEFKECLTNTLSIKNMELKMLGLPEVSVDEIFNEYKEYAKEISKFVCDTSLLIEEELEKGSKILFEGAQGVMLCIDHGTYPYVTSSSPTGAAVPLNCGIAPKYINNVLGICKAYTTRVGSGPFPTEIDGDLANYIRERGHEYGTVTKRPRRIGWLDCVTLNYARRVSGINYLSIMLLDVLTGLDEIKICYEYDLDGKALNTVPATLKELEKVTPKYITLKGWKEDITQVKSFDELPENAKIYIRKIEELTKAEVAIFSVGPDRSQTIKLKELF